jgi:hypothetical protein
MEYSFPPSCTNNDKLRPITTNDIPMVAEPVFNQEIKIFFSVVSDSMVAIPKDKSNKKR